MQDRKATVKPSCPDVETGRKQTSKMLYLLPFTFLVFGGGLVGCSNSMPLGIHGLTISDRSGNVTKISDIPQSLDSAATVYLQGQVATRAPFLTAGAYKLQDATGTIWIITNETVPDVGDEVLIKGQLQFRSIPLGGQEFGEVYVQEQEVLQRRAAQSQSPVLLQGS